MSHDIFCVRTSFSPPAGTPARRRERASNFGENGSQSQGRHGRPPEQARVSPKHPLYVRLPLYVRFARDAIAHTHRT